MNETGWLDHAPILAKHRVAWSEDVVLEQALIATSVSPPIDLVTSARAVVVHGTSMLVLSDRDGTRHVVPGGRIEPGESWLETTHREVREETGLTIHVKHQIGLIVSTHQLPKPSDYPYPYPMFLQVIYLATAVDPLKLDIEDEWVSSGAFLPIADARALHLPPLQAALVELTAATLVSSNQSQASGYSDIV